MTQSINDALWQQKTYDWKDFGIDAFTEKKVPFYISSNPFIARQYAQIASALLSKHQKLTVLELGAGSGQFTYLFLRAMQNKMGLKYIMSDFSQKTLNFWSSHKSLAPFIKSGILDYILYDPLKDAIEIDGPLLVIANYFFDCTLQDLFLAKNQKLFRGKCRLLAQKKIAFQKGGEVKSPAYDNELYQQMLEYNQRGKGWFFLPTKAFEVIDNLLKVTKDEITLLVGDCRSFDEEKPHVLFYSSFIAMPTNYSALARFVEARGGGALLSKKKSSIFEIGLFLLRGCVEQALIGAFDEMENLTPKEFWEFGKKVEQESMPVTMDRLSLLMKISSNDPLLFSIHIARIKETIPRLTKEEKERLTSLIQEVSLQFFAIRREDSFFITDLGQLLFEMQRYFEATAHFKEALLIYPQNLIAAYHLSLCYQGQGDAKSALESLQVVKQYCPGIYEQQKSFMLESFPKILAYEQSFLKA